MRTLFQVHADMTSLKSRIKQLEPLWQPQDGILLLGETLAYLDWLEAYLAETDGLHVEYLFALQSDFEALDEHTRRLLNISSRRCELITDQQWVALTVANLLNAVDSGDANSAATVLEQASTGFDRIVTLA